MKITVLVDNYTLIGKYYLGEPGLSLLLESDECKILFDTGYSDIFLRNAQKLGIDLSDIDAIVISHGHDDHTGGLRYLAEKFDLQHVPLFAHPFAFQKKYENGHMIGSSVSQLELERLFSVYLEAQPKYISERLLYLGEIPELLEFDKRIIIGEVERGGEITPDYGIDDTALVYIGDEGCFIITGCSHAGIGNIVEYAEQLTGKRAVGIIGGLHFLEVDDRLIETTNYLVRKSIDRLYPCHCVSFDAKAYIHSHIAIQEIGVSSTIEI